jgi:riboflavin transporter FmnP
MNKKLIVQTTASVALLLSPLAAFAQDVIPRFGFIGGTLEQAIFSILTGFLVLVGIAALIVLVIGGIRYIISAGNEDEVGKAKNTILYAVVGLVVVALALAILRFVASVIQGMV